MATVLEEFEASLASLKERFGGDDENYVLDDDGGCTVEVEGWPVNLSYQIETDTVIAYAECGALEEEPDFYRRALAANDRFYATKGFTLSYNRDIDRAVMHDRRYAGVLSNPDALAAWLEAAAKVSQDVRLMTFGQSIEPEQGPEPSNPASETMFMRV